MTKHYKIQLKHFLAVWCKIPKSIIKYEMNHDGDMTKTEQERLKNK
jgi:hypothetical protein